MSFNSKAYLDYQERLLEPEILLGTYRRHSDLRTSMSDKNAWLNGLSQDQRDQLRIEAEYEFEKLKHL